MRKIIAGFIFAALFFVVAAIYGCTSCSYTPDESSGDITGISEASKGDIVSDDVSDVSKENVSTDESSPENVSKNVSDEASDDVSKDASKPDDSSNTTSKDASDSEASEETSKDVSAPETSDDTNVDVSKPEESEVSKEEKPPVETSKDVSDAETSNPSNDNTSTNTSEDVSKEPENNTSKPVEENVAPTLTMSAPKGSSKDNPVYVTTNSYVVKGATVDKDGIKSVTVNGVKAEMRQNGMQWNWEAEITGLKENAVTEITVVSTDKTGKTTELKGYLYYDKPAENEKRVFAIFSDSDGSLTFYNNADKIAAGDVYNGKIVTEIYIGFDVNQYSAASAVPWYKVRRSIYSVKIADEFAPKHIAYWFYQFTNCETFVLDKLNTKNTIDMSYVFFQAGSSAKTFDVDMSNWNTSSVTNMQHMFEYAGRSATTFNLNLSGWNVGAVKNMSKMFNCAGENSASWNINGVSAWNVSSVTNMERMFASAARSVQTEFSLDLSKWNTKSVTNMNGMFTCTGYESQSFYLNLTGWNTSSVTNMNSMFSSAGRTSNTFRLVGLEKWNTSSVTDVKYAFELTGRNANYSLDLSGWNVSNVTSSDDFNYGVETKVIAPNFK